MNKKTTANQINRRSFLKTSAKFATSAMILGLGGNRLFGRGSVSSADVAIDKVTLNNGIKMPILGFGTLYLNDEKGAACVADAISLGYRLLDTATVYGNEAAVGAGIKMSGIKREELFITSKLWVDDSGYEKAKTAFELSLKKLGTDYLDLYLIHRPRGDVKGSWKAMEELYAAGRIKAIGVSNFDESQLKDLIDNNKVKPVINQIETHAYFQETIAYDYLKKYGVQMEAWSPFAQGRNGLFTNAAIAEIATKYNKSVAQVCLRWHYQRGIVAIPRSSQKAHMKENLEIFDFKLNEADMMKISKLDLNISQFPEWT
jgi:2,5-diketo-D-gluconate reductase A